MAKKRLGEARGRLADAAAPLSQALAPLEPDMPESPREAFFTPTRLQRPNAQNRSHKNMPSLPANPNHLSNPPAPRHLPVPAVAQKHDRREGERDGGYYYY